MSKDLNNSNNIIIKTDLYFLRIYNIPVNYSLMNIALVN